MCYSWWQELSCVFAVFTNVGSGKGHGFNSLGCGKESVGRDGAVLMDRLL